MEYGVNGASAAANPSEVRVDCRSEFTYPERPLAFWWPVDKEERLVVHVIESGKWRSPEGVASGWLFRTDGGLN